MTFHSSSIAVGIAPVGNSDTYKSTNKSYIKDNSEDRGGSTTYKIACRNHGGGGEGNGNARDTLYSTDVFADGQIMVLENSQEVQVYGKDQICTAWSFIR